jgi:hypothetical protein
MTAQYERSGRFRRRCRSSGWTRANGSFEKPSPSTSADPGPRDVALGLTPRLEVIATDISHEDAAPVERSPLARRSVPTLGEAKKPCEFLERPEDHHERIAAKRA